MRNTCGRSTFDLDAFIVMDIPPPTVSCYIDFAFHWFVMRWEPTFPWYLYNFLSQLRQNQFFRANLASSSEPLFPETMLYTKFILFYM